MTKQRADVNFVVKLNVGGVYLSTTANTLRKESGSLLAAVANGSASAEQGVVALRTDGVNVTFIDRDGDLFHYVLDFLRSGRLVLPDRFTHAARLKQEAKFYKLPGLLKALKVHCQHNAGDANKTIDETDVNTSCDTGGYITISYRGSFAFGRDGQSDVKFRKLNRILVCGKAALCRDVFGETLNESRDPDREGSERYTNRLYLKHQCLEKAFDDLAEKGFRMVASCACGANSGALSAGGLPFIPHGTVGATSSPPVVGDAAGSHRFGLNIVTEEQRWGHYTEFIFCKDPVPDG